MKAILVINSGSSTIKFSLFALLHGNLVRKYKGMVDRVLIQPVLTSESADGKEKFAETLEVSGCKDTYYQQAIEYILNWVTSKGFEIVGAGHRIVHSGPNYSEPVVLNDKITQELLDLTPIMPLHQPANINGVKILQEKMADVPQIGCFDTGFHATCNPISQTFAIPKKFRVAGIRRYGFHGLSYEYIATHLQNYMSEKEANGKFIVCHLGNGSTMCAIEHKKSVATSIGFTGLGGLPMGTRCDSLDPGTVLYLQEAYNLTTDELRNILYRECGLLGVSELSSDMRTLLESDSPEAKLAIDIYVHRIAIMAGQLAVELQGVDGIIFTAGIGENAPPIREMVCEKLKWLGVDLDVEKNKSPDKSARKISCGDSKIQVWVMPTDEEVVIAHHTLDNIVL